VTRRCPRRHIRDNPDATAALAIWRACDGKPGVRALQELSTHAVDAFAVIDSGRAAKMESDAARAKANQAAQDAAAPRGRR
jgi:hypothetical protein